MMVGDIVYRRSTHDVRDIGTINTLKVFVDCILPALIAEMMRPAYNTTCPK